MTTIDPHREILERLKKLESELGYAADIFQNGGLICADRAYASP
jgi:hypothetical protein